MKHRMVGILLIVGSLLVVWVLPAGAITGDDKSYDARVGALFATVMIPNPDYDPGPPEVGPEFFEDGPFIVCSGSQATAEVFLTAGHCLVWTKDLPPGFWVQWSVSFDDEPFDAATGESLSGATLLAASEAVYDPGFGHDSANLKDYGVVLFDGDDKLPGPLFVELPYLGQLDDMKRNKELKGYVFDRAGYGVHPTFKEGPPTFWDDGHRYETQSPYKALNQNWLRLNENEDATGLGGGCYGDSGSPILGASGTDYADIAFAVTTGGDPICRSDAYNQRLDTAEAQAFLRQFLTLPTP